MWKLTVEDDEGKQTAVPLQGAECSFGRGDGNQVTLTDRNVSRRHAALRPNGEGWVLRDLESYNGTYVNGLRVAGEQHVQSGDVIQIGDYRIEIALVPDHAVPGAAPTGTFQAVQHRPDRLVIVVGPNPGTEFPLTGEAATIGRSEEATISINHASVSRVHADLVALGGGRFEVIDRDSANGIRINGVELRRGIIEAGDALELGDVRLRFVGAGKVFRGADQTQQLRALSFEQLAPGQKVEAQKGSPLRIVLLVAIILAIAAAIFMVVRASTSGKRGSVGQTKEEAAAADNILASAKALYDKGDLQGAHDELQQLAEGAPQREAPIVGEIEGKWADDLFGKVEKAAEAGEKRRLLARIYSASMVDPDRRKKAFEMLQKIAPADASGDPMPNIAPPRPQQTYVPPPQSTPDKPATTGKASGAPAPGVPIGMEGYAARRKSLEGKVWSGKASDAEIKELAAICGHMGDRVCRSRAQGMLKKNNP